MIHVGDCIEWMRTLEDKSVDHVITDPPYEVEAHTKGRRCKRGGGVREEPLEFGAMDEVLRASVCQEVARLVRRWVIVFCQAEAVGTWRAAMEGAGLAWKRPGIWVKPDAQPSLLGDRPGMGYESICCAHAPVKSRWNGGGRGLVITANKNREDLGHQTVKPVPVMERLVRDFTDPGDLVIDPFVGSGTTGVACLKQGRRFLGCEIDPKHAETARRRLADTREQKEMFG